MRQYYVEIQQLSGIIVIFSDQDSYPGFKSLSLRQFKHLANLSAAHSGKFRRSGAEHCQNMHQKRTGERTSGLRVVPALFSMQVHL